MCDICGRDFSTIEYTIEMGNNILKICPNCSVGIAAHQIPLEPGDCNSEISGNSGAVKITSNDSEYVLTPPEAVRLFGHSLMPDEYLKLIKKHSPDVYELHDDFYSNDGIAFQPYDEDEYDDKLRKLADSPSVDEKVRKNIQLNLFFMDNPEMLDNREVTHILEFGSNEEIFDIPNKFAKENN